ncbi:MAG: low temperature requirement protein A [Hyphomicrobiales bacterium]|nr:low temperature requirement protein A [Hyphomicrobiales bacterium]
MSGRDPHEAHRAATPLELLYDLTFVIGIGNAAGQLAHLLAEGHFGAGAGAFIICMVSIVWAWINFSWFSSAYDTDDWVFRLAVMTQMVGVVVLSIGVPRLFESLDTGAALETGAMVFGYVIMRLAMVFLWLRAALQDARHRRTCLIYAFAIFVAQIGWVLLFAAGLSRHATYAGMIAMAFVELSAPVFAERLGEGSPWHAHHIAERYGLLVIITLGEGVVGTVAAVSAMVQNSGWSSGAIAVCAAGLGVTFGMWWIYFVLPAAPLLHKYRSRAYVWAYGHIAIFAAVAAVGAGLHVAALFIDHKAHIDLAETVLTIAVPLAIYILGVFGLYAWMVRGRDLFHLLLLALTAAAIALSVAMAQAGYSVVACLGVLTLAPAVSVIGYETVGWAHARLALARALGEAD